MERLGPDRHVSVVRPMHKTIKATFDSLPWWQYLDPGQPPRYKVVSPRERANRHKFFSANMEYALNNYNLQD